MHIYTHSQILAAIIIHGTALVFDLCIVLSTVVWRHLFEEPIDHLLHQKSCEYSVIEAIQFITNKCSAGQHIQWRNVASFMGYRLRLFTMGNSFTDFTCFQLT